MSDIAIVNPLIVPQTVERNGVTQTLKVFVGKRDAWKDKPYQAVQLETDGTDSTPANDSVFLAGLTFWGKTNVVRAINTIARRFGQDFVDDSTGDADTAKAGGLADGVFSMDRFLTYWKELRASAMRLSELNEAYQTAVAEFGRFSTEDFMAAVDSGDAYRIGEAKKKMNSLNATVKSLRAEFEERKARRSKEAATESIASE